MPCWRGGGGACRPQESSPVKRGVRLPLSLFVPTETILNASHGKILLGGCSFSLRVPVWRSLRSPIRYGRQPQDVCCPRSGAAAPARQASVQRVHCRRRRPAALAPTFTQLHTTSKPAASPVRLGLIPRLLLPHA